MTDNPTTVAVLAMLRDALKPNDDRVPPKKVANIRHAIACLEAISPTNREAAARFLNWKIRYDQRSTASVTAYAQLARDLDRILGGNRPYSSTTHEDGMRYVEERGRSVKNDGLSNELTRVKHFLKWCLRDAGQVDLQQLPYRLHQSLTIRRKSKRRVKKERPLSELEFRALMEAAKNEPDAQALYNLCWEADIRIGEGLVLNWEEDYHYQDDGGAVVAIPNVEGFAKTQDRSPYVYQSVRTMRVWEALHPFGGAAGTPIFTTKIRPYRRASYHAVRNRLIRHLKKAGIRQNIHFHLFRKSGITRRARTMDPDEFRAYHGFSAGSRVATEYVMDSHEEARKTIRREAGILDDGQPMDRVEVGMKVCPFCAEQIKVAAIKCKHCGEMVGSTTAADVWRAAI